MSSPATQTMLIQVRESILDTWTEGDSLRTVFTLRDKEANTVLSLSSEVVVALIDNYLKYS